MRRGCSRWIVPVSALAIAAAVVGCSSSGSSPEPSSASPTASSGKSASPTPTSGAAVEFKAELSSQYSRVATAGPDDTFVYGYSQLEGYTKINDRQVRVRLQGLVDNDDGSGPTGGFLELRWSDGTVLAFRQDGTVTYDSAAKATSIQANLTVIGGTRQAAPVTGGGSYVGAKKSTSGSTVRIAVSLTLEHAPSMITGGGSGSRTPSASYSATVIP